MGINPINMSKYDLYRQNVDNNYSSTYSCQMPVISTIGNQTTISNSLKKNQVKDGKDDGSIGLSGAVKNMAKGAVKFFTNMFTDENGNFSLKQTAKTVGMIGAITAATYIPIVGPLVLPALCTWGIVEGGINIVKGLRDALTATTDAQAQQAWQSVGSGTTEGVLSYIGYKATKGWKGAWENSTNQYKALKQKYFSQKPVEATTNKAETSVEEGTKIMQETKAEAGVKPKNEAQNNTAAIAKNKKADALLKELRSEFNADYVESRLPEVVKDVRNGKIQTQQDLQYYKYLQLETLRKENPDAFLLLGEESGQTYFMSRMMDNYRHAVIKLTKDMTVEEMSQAFHEINTFYSKLDVEPTIENKMSMLVMKKYNPETYNYILTTTDKRVGNLIAEMGCDYSMCPSSALFENLTIEQIHIMIEDTLPPMKHIGDYVGNSNDFLGSSEAVSELSKNLAKHHISRDVVLYRGEQSVGMFEQIRINKTLEAKIRQLLELNKENALQMSIKKLDGIYGRQPNTNLYEYIQSKESLSLADAMQVARYGDEILINEIISCIKNVKLIDTRFKSFSIDKNFAESWSGHNAGNTTTIIQNATVKQGTQGGYHRGDNAQYEVILNNTPKEITFQDVIYDPKTDSFEINSTIRNI